MKKIDFYIQRISQLQSNGDEYFSTGLFPAIRQNPQIKYTRPDTTIFFTAIICFTLQRIKPFLDKQNQQIVEDILEKAILNYPKFQNKDGLKTYNFWQTKPSKHFPNGYIFRHLEHFRIPDDVDDTAMIYLTSNPSHAELTWLKQKLTQHANLSKIQIRNTFPEYRNLKAYSTWFGKNMYIEFDVCVLCNLMYCIFEYKLPLNQHDFDSLTYIRSTIETNRYLEVPFRVAHQYPRTVPIVYHLARLMGAFEIPELEPIRAKLIADTKNLLTQPQHWLDAVVLHIALMRLGETDLPDLKLPEPIEASDFEGFYFFIAGLLTAYQHPMLYKMASLPLFHIRWECEAHCWALLAEYETLRNNL